MHRNQTVDLSGASEEAGQRRNPLERARKNARIIGRHIDDAGLQPVADFAGISKSTVGAWFNENRDAMGKALAFMGLKVVPVTMKCYDPAEIEAILTLARNSVNRMRSADDLNFEDAE